MPLPYSGNSDIWFTTLISHLDPVAAFCDDDSCPHGGSPYSSAHTPPSSLSVGSPSLSSVHAPDCPVKCSI